MSNLSSQSKLADLLAIIELLEEERSRLDTTIAVLKERTNRLRLSEATHQLSPASASKEGHASPAAAGLGAELEYPPKMRDRPATSRSEQIGATGTGAPPEGDEWPDFYLIQDGKEEFSEDLHPTLKAFVGEGISVLSDLRMRIGSKKHRVYMAVKQLLGENGSMHIEEMLNRISPMGVFDDVKEKRVNFANILSQLKGKGLLISDNRGNWSLPDLNEETKAVR